MSETVSIGNIEINNSGIGGFLRSLGVARVAAMATVAVGMIGFFIFLIMRFNQPHLTVLFSDLEFKDSIEIVKKLEGMNVPHEVRGDGAVILVPKERVLKLRLSMAEDGLPAGGTIGYEIFDKGNTLGATNFVQNINHLRAAGAEVADAAPAVQAADHVVAGREAGDAFAHGLDHAGGLVPEDGRRGQGDAALDHVQVAVADARGRRLDQDLTGTGRVDLDLLDAPVFADVVKDGSPCLHGGEAILRPSSALGRNAKSRGRP